jgi:hypothetical protein
MNHLLLIPTGQLFPFVDRSTLKSSKIKTGSIGLIVIQLLFMSNMFSIKKKQANIQQHHMKTDVT